MNDISVFYRNINSIYEDDKLLDLLYLKDLLYNSNSNNIFDKLSKASANIATKFFYDNSKIKSPIKNDIDEEDKFKREYTKFFIINREVLNLKIYFSKLLIDDLFIENNKSLIDLDLLNFLWRQRFKFKNLNLKSLSWIFEKYKDDHRLVSYIFRDIDFNIEFFNLLNERYKSIYFKNKQLKEKDVVELLKNPDNIKKTKLYLDNNISKETFFNILNSYDEDIMLCHLFQNDSYTFLFKKEYFIKNIQKIIAALRDTNLKIKISAQDYYLFFQTSKKFLNKFDIKKISYSFDANIFKKIKINSPYKFSHLINEELIAEYFLLKNNYSIISWAMKDHKARISIGCLHILFKKNDGKIPSYFSEEMINYYADSRLFYNYKIINENIAEKIDNEDFLNYYCNDPETISQVLLHIENLKKLKIFK